ncbi:SCO4983 family protein, partial [Streptomyces sparsus]
MYEPIRNKSVHTMAEQPVSGDRFPQRSREAELDIRLAGHLTALLTVTDELRALTPSVALDAPAHRLATQVARLRDGRAPLRAEPSFRGAGPGHSEAL